MTKVTTHNGVIITLGDDGYFHATSKGRTEGVRDGTLSGLKKKLDNITRASARAQALALPATVLVIDENYYHDRIEAKWMTGTFAGINAHTGDITFLVNGKRHEFDNDDAYFFRSDDPAVDRIRELVERRLSTNKVAEEARDKLERALETHGHKIQVVTARSDSGKTDAAARAEQQLIDVLAPPPPAAPAI